MMINCQVIWLTINLFIWKSFPSANNCQIYFSIYYHFLKWFINPAAELFSSAPFQRHFIIISEASVLAHGTRWMPLCCFTQNWAVITGAESPSCPLAGSHWSAQSHVNDEHWWSCWFCFFTITGIYLYLNQQHLKRVSKHKFPFLKYWPGPLLFIYLNCWENLDMSVPVFLIKYVIQRILKIQTHQMVGNPF